MHDIEMDFTVEVSDLKPYYIETQDIDKLYYVNRYLLKLFNNEARRSDVINSIDLSRVLINIKTIVKARLMMTDLKYFTEKYPNLDEINYIGPSIEVIYLSKDPHHLYKEYEIMNMMW